MCVCVWCVYVCVCVLVCLCVCMCVCVCVWSSGELAFSVCHSSFFYKLSTVAIWPLLSCLCFNFGTIVVFVCVCDIRISVQNYWWGYWALSYLNLLYGWLWFMIKEIVIVRYVPFLCCWLFTKNSTASVQIIHVKSLQKTTLHNLINLPLSSTAKYDNKVKKQTRS